MVRAYRSSMQLLVRPHFMGYVYSDTHTIGSCITNTLLFLEASSGIAVLGICSIPWSSDARHFTSGYFCLHICGFGLEGCETVQFERSRFGSWRSAVPWHVINADGRGGTHALRLLDLWKVNGLLVSRVWVEANVAEAPNIFHRNDGAAGSSLQVKQLLNMQALTSSQATEGSVISEDGSAGLSPNRRPA